MDNQDAVAITGMGIICSTGIGVPAFKEVLFCGSSNFSRLSFPMLPFPVLGASINNFSFSHALLDLAAPSSFLSVDRCQQLTKIASQSPYPIQTILIAALEAWQQAALDNPITNDSRFVIGKSEFFPVRIALSKSFGFGGINTTIVLGNHFIGT